MAWLNRRTRESLGIGLVGLFVWGGAAWGQLVVIAIPPSQLKPGEKSEGFMGFGCYDIRTLVFINCHVTVRLDPLDPAAMIPPFFGGHIGHAPQRVGTVRDINGTGPGGDSVEGDTLKGFSVVYTAPEASGQVQVTTRLAPPPSYLCLFEPDPDGSGACKHVRRINVGIPLQDLNLVDPTRSDPSGTNKERVCAYQPRVADDPQDRLDSILGLIGGLRRHDHSGK